MKEIVFEDLGEKDLDTTLGELLHVDAMLTQCGNIANHYAMDALHNQHITACHWPVNLRDIELV